MQKKKRMLSTAWMRWTMTWQTEMTSQQLKNNVIFWKQWKTVDIFIEDQEMIVQMRQEVHHHRDRTTAR